MFIDCNVNLYYLIPAYICFYSAHQASKAHRTVLSMSRNSTRDREAAERRDLRLLVHTLESHIAQLSSHSQRRSRGPTASFWRRVAGRQQLARDAVQRENAALHAEVQRRADWIERLWNLLCETQQFKLIREARLHGAALDVAVVSGMRSMHSAVFSWTNALQAFAAEGIPVTGRCLDQGQPDLWSMTVDSHTGSCRLVGQRRIPFDIHTTAKAVWASLARLSSTKGQIERQDLPCQGFRVLERSLDTCGLTYTLRRADYTPAPLRCHAVVHAVGVQSVRCSCDPDDTATCQLAVFVLQSRCSITRDVVVGIDTIYVAISTCSAAALTSTISVIAKPQTATQFANTERALSQRLFTDIASGTEACVAETLASAENALVDSGLRARSWTSGVEEEAATV